MPRVVSGTGGDAASTLHVWGGGVDRRVPAAAGSTLGVALPATAFKPRYYFAALEDGSGGAMSAAVPLESSSELTGNACRTRLVLEFEAAAATRGGEVVLPVSRTR